MRAANEESSGRSFTGDLEPYKGDGHIGYWEANDVEGTPFLRVVEGNAPEDSRPAADMRNRSRHGWAHRVGVVAALPSLALVVIGGLLEAHGHVRTGGMVAMVGIVTTLLSMGVHRAGAGGSGRVR